MQEERKWKARFWELVAVAFQDQGKQLGKGRRRNSLSSLLQHRQRQTIRAGEEEVCGLAEEVEESDHGRLGQIASKKTDLGTINRR